MPSWDAPEVLALQGWCPLHEESSGSAADPDLSVEAATWRTSSQGHKHYDPIGILSDGLKPMSHLRRLGISLSHHLGIFY